MTTSGLLASVAALLVMLAIGALAWWRIAVIIDTKVPTTRASLFKFFSILLAMKWSALIVFLICPQSARAFIPIGGFVMLLPEVFLWPYPIKAGRISDFSEYGLFASLAVVSSFLIAVVLNRRAA